MDQNGQSNSSNVEDSSCSEETEIDLLEQRYAQLNESFKNFEDLDVREKPEYQPKNPCETPDFFPKECYHRRTLKEFRKLDIETFFFIFYFQQGTIEQNFAAKILKGNSWRFHKHFLTWFQRSKEP
ncbi:general negative regulator of transcription subunit 5, partial [Bonamia ostreae]